MNARWVAQVAASAAIRKVVYVLLAVCFAAIATCGKAHAQTAPTYEEAHVTCMQMFANIDPAQYSDATPASDNCTDVNGGYGTPPNEYGRLYCRFLSGVSGPFSCGDTPYSGHSPAVDCTGKPNLGPQSVTGAMYACSGGCRYQQDTAVSVCLGDGADMFCAATSWKATGDDCGPNDKAPQSYKPDQSVCHATGGSYQECVKPSGEHCVKGASGQQLCWTPTSLGERMTTDGTLAGNRQEAPSTPTPPANQQNPTNVTTTTTTVGGNTYNTSISTGTGSKPGQSDTGVPGDKDGDGKKDDGEGDEDGPGGVGSGVGSLYEGNGKTVSSVYATFKTQMEGTAIVGAAGNFLTVSVGGSCPSWTVPATAYWEAMPFDWLCSGPLSEALAFGAYLLLAIAAYTAFKIGFG